MFGASQLDPSKKYAILGMHFYYKIPISAIINYLDNSKCNYSRPNHFGILVARICTNGRLFLDYDWQCSWFHRNTSRSETNIWIHSQFHTPNGHFCNDAYRNNIPCSIVIQLNDSDDCLHNQGNYEEWSKVLILFGGLYVMACLIFFLSGF